MELRAEQFFKIAQLFEIQNAERRFHIFVPAILMPTTITHTRQGYGFPSTFRGLSAT
jgi:hypothetical protein